MIECTAEVVDDEVTPIRGFLSLKWSVIEGKRAVIRVVLSTKELLGLTV